MCVCVCVYIYICVCVGLFIASMTMDYAKIGQQHIRDLKAELGCS